MADRSTGTTTRRAGADRTAPPSSSTWRDSPHVLFQEWLRRDSDYPWRMLVGCCLVNQTTGAQARPALAEILKRWPTPLHLATANASALRSILRPLGLWRMRGKRVTLLSLLWWGGVRDPRLLPGVGPYALASWSIFVDGVMPKKLPEDGKLKAYVRHMRKKRC